MGYYIINHNERFEKLVVAAMLRFTSHHVVELPPRVTLDLVKKTVTVISGKTVTYTFEELGF